MFLFDIFVNKPKQETTEENCKKFLKNVIVNETKLGSKRFRKDLYKRLLKYGVCTNYDFCMELDEDDFIAKAGYKKASDILLMLEIRKAVIEKHFKHLK